MQNDNSISPGAARRGRWYKRGGPGFRAAALVLIIASLSGMGFLMACLLRTPPSAGTEPEKATAKPRLPAHLFHGWPKDPDLVLVLTGERHGYVLPCGCSKPQVGGIERLYNFVQILKEERGWTVLPLDLGDTPQKEGPAGLPNVQGVLKYYYTMRAMHTVGFQATSFGEYEAAQPLTFLLDNIFSDPSLALPPLLACNLRERKDFVVDKTEEVRAWNIAEVKGPKLRVGVVGAIGVDVGQTIHDKVDKSLSFNDLRVVLPATLKEVNAQKPDLRVLLYHGMPAQATELAKTVKQFDVILSMSEADIAPGKSDQVGNTMIVPGLGHKGKDIGVVGVWRTGKAANPFDMRYQLVSLGEEYLTPKEKENDHPITKLMEQYTKDLKAGDYLHKYPQTNLHPIHELIAKDDDYKEPSWFMMAPKEVKYVGSGACKRCHEESYRVWLKTPHHHAYETLEKIASRPSLRQYDAECIVCHTVGFTVKGGFVDAKATPDLINVGCESCHGPGSPHLQDNYDKKILALMNPYKAKPNEMATEKTIRINGLNQFCQKCHDLENDVNWELDKRWPVIVHHEPKQ